MMVVRSPLELDDLTDEVHDWFFDFDDLVAQSGECRVLDIRPSSKHFLKGDKSNARELQIHNVTGVLAEDTEKIGCYDINEFKYSNGVLEITTGVPLSLKILVNGLHLELC